MFADWPCERRGVLTLYYNDHLHDEISCANQFASDVLLNPREKIDIPDGGV